MCAQGWPGGWLEVVGDLMHFFPSPGHRICNFWKAQGDLSVKIDYQEREGDQTWSLWLMVECTISFLLIYECKSLWENFPCAVSHVPIVLGWHLSISVGFFWSSAISRFEIQYRNDIYWLLFIYILLFYFISNLSTLGWQEGGKGWVVMTS